MNTFATIITSDHAPYALTLYKSLRKHAPEASLQVLVVDEEANFPKEKLRLPEMKVYFLASLSGYKLVDELYNKYYHTEKDSFRWSVKPLFISYLIENGYEKVIYVDADIYFYQNPQFLLDQLDSSAILITPHWRNTNPLADEKSFLTLFTSGIYNAGFIGANKQGLPALNWWAEACHYKMGAHPEYGIHDDQRYLDLLPVEFENVKIIQHRGCNISGWNKEACRRVMVKGEVKINGIFPVIFIHYNREFIKDILKGHDALLLPYFREFKMVFEEAGDMLVDFMSDLNYHIHPGGLVKMKWRLKLRTRIKSILFKLAENL